MSDIKTIDNKLIDVPQTNVETLKTDVDIAKVETPNVEALKTDIDVAKVETLKSDIETSNIEHVSDQTFFQKLSLWANNTDILRKIKTMIPIVIICLIGFFIWLMIMLFTPKSKQKKEVLFGNDVPAQTKEQNSKQVKIDEVERQLQERITNINTNLTALKKRMDDADIVKDNKPTNLAIAIQNNILAVKEAMMKIIAGLVIQTKMNNGAINVVSQTNAFQQNIDESINKIVNKK